MWKENLVIAFQREFVIGLWCVNSRDNILETVKLVRSRRQKVASGTANGSDREEKLRRIGKSPLGACGCGDEQKRSALAYAVIYQCVKLNGTEGFFRRRFSRMLREVFPHNFAGVLSRRLNYEDKGAKKISRWDGQLSENFFFGGVSLFYATVSRCFEEWHGSRRGLICD